MSDQVQTTLPRDTLKALKHTYNRDAMTAVLSGGMPARYAAVNDYVKVISAAFYSGEGQTTPPRDRERCLIAILASRDAGANLAIHIYLGLMEGLSLQEIADIIYLAGIYTGVDRLSDGLSAYVRTLGVLAK